MNPITNQRLLEAFIAAKELLSLGDYICHAILRAKVFGIISEEVEVAATAIIMSRLDGIFTVGQWLKHNIPELKGELVSKEIQFEFRQRWLDSLITEFSQGE